MYIILFTWDIWNTTHIKRNSVIYQEVEEILQRKYIAFQNYKKRIVIIGKTKVRRALVVIMESTDKRGIYYVITARIASQKERKLYQERKRVIIV